MAGHQPLKKRSVTLREANYIKANYNRMTYREIAFNLKLHPVKVQRNMEFFGLIQIKRGAVKTKIKEPVFNTRIFNVDYYARQTSTI